MLSGHTAQERSDGRISKIMRGFPMEQEVILGRSLFFVQRQEHGRLIIASVA